MTTFKLQVDPDSAWQARTLTVSPDGHTQTMRVELRFLSYTGKWYLSFFRLPEGECLLAHVPLVACGQYINDLLDLFGYKNLGSILCLPLVSAMRGVDPAEDTLIQYDILWGDYIV